MWFRTTVTAAAFVCLAACNRDPNVAKQRYLESGDRYFDKGAHRQASIMYRNAVKADPKFGIAYYKLGVVAIKQGQPAAAISPLRRAVELLGAGTPERLDAQVKVADIYLAVMEAQRYNTDYAADVLETSTELLNKDPQHFDGLRLRGSLHFVAAQNMATGRIPGDAKGELDAAVTDLQAANRRKGNDPAVIVHLARGLSLQQRFGDAEALYRKMVAEHKTQVSGYLEWYRLLMFEKRTAEAEAALKLAIENNPKDYELLIALATHYYREKQRDQVVKTLEVLKSHAKDYSKAYETAGTFYFRLGDGAEAIRQYEEGMRLDSSNRRKYQKLIVEVLSAQGKREDAMKINDEILKADPKDADALGLQATLLIERGQLQEAINQLQSVVTQSPDNPQALFNLGRAFLAKGEVEQARQRFMEVVRIRPNHTQSRIMLGQIQLNRREFDSVVKTAEDILAYDGSNAGAFLLRSAGFIGQKDYTRARASLDALLKVNTNSLDALYQLGLLDMLEKKYKEAEAPFRKCYDLNPNHSRGLMGQVDAVMAQNQPDRAMAILRQEIGKFPTRMEFRIAMAGAAIRARNPDLAISEYRWVLDRVDKTSPVAGDVYYRLSDVLRATGKTEEATASLEAAHRILPDNTRIAITLGSHYESYGKKAEAQAVYQRVLLRDQDNPIALNNIANIIAETPGGDLDQALTYAQRARQKAPQSLEIADTVGLIYLKKGLTDNALEIFSECVRKTPAHPTYRLHLAQAFFQKGDKVKAKEEARQALAAKPNKADETGIRDLLSKIGG